MFRLMPWRKEEGREERFYPLETMRNEFESLFNRFFGPRWLEPEHEAFWGWNVETEEKENELKIRMEVPGFEPNELEVMVTGERMTVKAEHKKEKEEKKEKEKEELIERRYHRFERTILLPEGVEAEKAEAVYHNGILEVKLPKKAEARPRKVEVKA
jgi:HSP20 family protein